MAITFSTLTSGTGSGTSATTASITLTANRLVLLVVVNTQGDFNPAQTPTCTGWTQISTSSYFFDSVDGNRLTVFRRMVGSDTTGTHTIDFSSVSQNEIAWAIHQSNNEVDTTGTNGSGAVVQSVTNTGNSTTPSATLAAFGSTNNATYGAFGLTVGANSVAGGSGFTELTTINEGAPFQFTLFTEYRSDNDTSVDASTGGAADWGVIALEIKSNASSGRTADAAITLGSLTSSSAATLALRANATPTLGALTSSSAAALSLKADASITLGAATVSSAAALRIDGDADITLGALTLASESTLTDGRTAAADITLGAATLASAATVALAGAASITLGALASSSQAAVAIDADLDVTMGAVTLASEAIIVSGGTGALDVTLGALTVFAEGELGPAVSAPVQGPGFFAGGYYEPIKKAEPKAPRLRAPRQAAKKTRAVEPLPALAAAAAIELGAMAASITARSSLFLVNGVQRTKPPLARSPSLESRVASIERALARITQSKEP